MARALGLDVTSVKTRIKNNPALQALRSSSKVATELSAEDVALRKKPRTPAGGIGAQQMAQVVRETERMIHNGLIAAKVSPETLATLRSLHGMTATTGEFMAQSVMDIQDLYSIELYKIPDRLSEIKRKYLDDDSLPGMERMFWQKAYTELLEQLGKGKDRMFAGAEALSAMLNPKKGEKAVGASKAKPGW
jgi:hypothetical protein